MKFDYKQGMQEREKLLIEQGKLLNQITETIKQPFQEWYTYVDKNRVTWFISQFLLDCGYCCEVKDGMMYFNIPTGVEEVGLSAFTAIVKQYSVKFVIGELSSQTALETLRGD